MNESIDINAKNLLEIVLGYNVDLLARNILGTLVLEINNDENILLIKFCPLHSEIEIVTTVLEEFIPTDLFIIIQSIENFINQFSKK